MQVKSGQLVMDPYAGTGSVMVAAAAFGAQVVGTDIDIRVSASRGCAPCQAKPRPRPRPRPRPKPRR